MAQVVDRDGMTWVVMTDQGAVFLEAAHGRSNLYLTADAARQMGRALLEAADKAEGIEPKPEDARCVCCGKQWVDVVSGFDTCDTCQKRA